MPDLTRRSAVDALATALRERILSGDLAPATHLSETDLAVAYGVGRHTLRAAFQLLVRDGLVVRVANRGAFVATPSPAESRDLFTYRAALEQGALDRALLAGASFAAAAEAQAALATLPADAPWAEVADAHHAIHAAIVDAAGSRRLSAAYAALRTELLFFVTQVRPWYTVARMIEAHRLLVDALGSGDPARARTALAADLAGGSETLAAAATGYASRE